MNESALKKAARNLSSDDLLVKDAFGRTLSHLAAEHSTALLKAATKKKTFAPNSLDDERNTPLMCAARSGDPRRIEILISAGATVDIYNRRGENALHFFCKNQRATAAQCEQVISLFARHDLHVYNRDDMGNTAAHTCTRHNALNALSYLVAQQYFQLESKNSYEAISFLGR